MSADLDREQLPWRVEHYALQFDIGPDLCRVSADLTAVRTAAPVGPLVLDGRGLDTAVVSVDGLVLDPGDPRWSITDDALIIDLDDGPSGTSRVITTDVAVQPGGPGDKGLWVNDGVVASNCEPQGFRRITWAQDRPDLRATFDVTLRADAEAAPFLLAAGERVDVGAVADGRHVARFVDPVAKPTYLFALVVGNLSLVTRSYTTGSGRSITLGVAAPPHLISGSGFALDTLVDMMQFDESVTGIEHDLETLVFVALPGYSDATEYQGVMFFSPNLLVVDVRGHVDDDLMLVLLNVAHEYGHHARGNRVAVETWQHLALKEGLTVLTAQNDFRRHVLGEAARIHEILDLRRLQYPEEVTIGAPVLRDVVDDPSQLYTRTTYLKGAEIFEMFRAALGHGVWSDTLRAFITRYDRDAAKLDDFVDEVRARSPRPELIDGIARWFTLAGRPGVAITRGDESDGTTTLSLVRTDRLSDDPPVVVPLRVGFLDLDGDPLSVEIETSIGRTVGAEHMIALTDRSVDVVVNHDRPFVLAPWRGLSPPIDLTSSISVEHLGILASHDPDPTTRWWAVQEIMTAVVDAERRDDVTMSASLVEEVLGPILDSACRTIPDTLLLGQLLTVPDEFALGDRDEVIDVDGVADGLESLRRRLGRVLHDRLASVVIESGVGETGGDSGADIARRSVIEPALALLLATRTDEAIEIARRELRSPSPTRGVRALTQILHLEDSDLAAVAGRPTAEELVADFVERWGDVPGLVDRAIRAQTGSRRSDTIDRVARIVGGDGYDRRDRNRVMAVWFPFATRNRAVFHDPSGAGYRLFVDELTELLTSDPGTVIRLVGDILQFRRFDERRQILMRRELERLATSPGLPGFAVGILRHLLDAPETIAE